MSFLIGYVLGVATMRLMEWRKRRDEQERLDEEECHSERVKTDCLK